MLTKRREIKDLEHEVSVITAQAAKLESELRTVETAIASDTKTEAELSQIVHRLEIEHVNGEKDCTAVSEEIGRSTERCTVLEAEARERETMRHALNADIQKSEVVLRDLETGHSNAQASAEALQAELSRTKQTLESARAEIMELRMQLAGLQEKQAASARSIDALLRTEADLMDRIGKREAGIAGVASRLAELHASIQEAETEIKGHITTLEADRTVLVALQEAHSVKAASLQAADEQARQTRHDIDAGQKQLSANEVKRTELRMKIEHLKDRIWSAYHSDLETVVQELGVFELNLEESRLRLDELRQKIDQLGPINVDALQEYNELRERYDLLSAQQNDINESINNLKATIAKLDGETKELFSDAFKAIQEKFTEVFSLLFEGGRAELVLLDESNMLESGIEIIAQPRGKKFQAISLLSGGERALTAIALLFAAFLVKPSPFCMLDEVDAPLDEANVTRFTRLLREMSSRSQFITITHNKRTMEMADALYGITMEEPGCSRVVSVQLREAALV